MKFNQLLFVAVCVIAPHCARSSMYRYLFVNLATNKCLGVTGVNNGGLGSNVVQETCKYVYEDSDQQWYFDSTDRLRNSASGYNCLDVTGTSPSNNGANVVMWTCESGPSDQKWQIVPHPDNSNVYFQLRNEATGKCLDISGHMSTLEGTNAQQWDCQAFSPTSDQWWKSFAMVDLDIPMP